MGLSPVLIQDSVYCQVEQVHISCLLQAVVNETPTERLIRELKEENARLMEQLKSGQLPGGATSFSGGESVSSGRYVGAGLA